MKASSPPPLYFPDFTAVDAFDCSRIQSVHRDVTTSQLGRCGRLQYIYFLNKCITPSLMAPSPGAESTLCDRITSFPERLSGQSFTFLPIYISACVWTGKIFIGSADGGMSVAHQRPFVSVNF